MSNDGKFYTLKRKYKIKGLNIRSYKNKKKPKDLRLQDIITKLYQLEINISITTSWDLGARLSFGDEIHQPRKDTAYVYVASEDLHRLNEIICEYVLDYFKIDLTKE